MRSLKLVVVTMVQAKDFPSAWSSLRPLSSQLSPSRTRIILLNDERDAGLEAELESLPFTALLTPGTNLGVARGRNALFDAALESEADFVVVLDDDLYVPADYLDIVHDAAASADEDLGILAPTVMDFGVFARANPDLVDVAAAVSGQIESTLSSTTLREGIDADDESMFYHLGTRDWKTHYLSPATGAGKDFLRLMNDASLLNGSIGVATTFLRSDARSRAIAGDAGSKDSQWVDTLAGGVSVFRAEMLRIIGMCDERFSPFGYEDADLCIRARQTGYRNAWVPVTMVLHDFQDRGRERSAEHRNFVLGRSKALLCAGHLPDDELPQQFEYAMSAYLVDAFVSARGRSDYANKPEQVLAAIAAFAIGYLDGASVPDSDGVALMDRLSDISTGHTLRSDSGTRWILPRIPIRDIDMAPVLSADFTIGNTDMAYKEASVDFRFPDGLTVALRVAYSHDPAAEGTEPEVHRLSFEGSSNGLTTRRILHKIYSARGEGEERDPFKRMFYRKSILERILRRLFSPDGRQRRVVARIDPHPPIGLTELASTSLDTATGVVRLGLSLTGQDCNHPTGVDTA